MKKAFLADFGFTTRIVAEDSLTEDELAHLVLEHIRENIQSYGLDSYVCSDNLGEIYEDTECPYTEQQPD